MFSSGEIAFITFSYATKAEIICWEFKRGGDFWECNRGMGLNRWGESAVIN